MADQTTTGGDLARCPWCSAELSTTDAATCPSCGASLHGATDQSLPGLTAIDPLAVIEGTRAPQRPRNRLVAWITGADIDEAAAPLASAEALAPPSGDVLLEMERLRIEAELAQRSADAEARVTDVAIAAADAGDTATAQRAVNAVLGTDRRTDALVESPEERELAARGYDGPTDTAAPAPSADAGAAADATAPAADATTPAAAAAPSDASPADGPADPA
jgi:hypothetical protein